jgi:hypothetical protein
MENQFSIHTGHRVAQLVDLFGESVLYCDINVALLVSPICVEGGHGR